MILNRFIQGGHLLVGFLSSVKVKSSLQVPWITSPPCNHAVYFCWMGRFTADYEHEINEMSDTSFFIMTFSLSI